MLGKKKHKNCLNCNKEFSTYYNKFCSRVCYWKDKIKREKVLCSLCKKEFFRKPCLVRKENYCSHFCSGKVNRSLRKTNSEATNKRMSIRMSGKIPQNIKLFMKKGELTRFKKGQFAKEKHLNWKGGITPINKVIRHSSEFNLWREAVFARDNWTCQKYGIKGGKLHPHHIQNFAECPELRFAIDNGITLLEQAHKAFHYKYGMKNNTEEQLLEYLNSKK